MNLGDLGLGNLGGDLGGLGGLDNMDIGRFSDPSSAHPKCD